MNVSVSITNLSFRYTSILPSLPLVHFVKSTFLDTSDLSACNLRKFGAGKNEILEIWNHSIRNRDI
jgi:hypothetical protein